ncbi:hypothetical protein F511_19461 [Dorcoceras hygrometricum]|uniref:Uncharacterized protein n=1 Tax=Dorcoceras hygrometricum TaxID=472368 RepID=A0A2Z6ZYE1_9LAMI|nr:hypothetical protein F511_19461 [Dorcoceras hygrometricum]
MASSIFVSAVGCYATAGWDFSSATAGNATSGVGIESLGLVFVVIVAQKYKDARSSGDTALSSPCWNCFPGYSAGRGADPSRGVPGGVLVAEESNKNWADTDSDSSSSSSSSSDSEQEEVHCLMANQSSDDEVFYFSNTEFTREDLITALNEMVQEYRNLSQTFEGLKVENVDLKNSSVEPRSVQLGKTDSLQIELSKLKAESDSLILRSSELKAENERLNEVMSYWTQSSVSLDKLCEIQKPANDRTCLGFNAGESSVGETSTQSYLVYDKFQKMSFVKASMTHDTCESVRYDDQNSSKMNQKGKDGIGYLRPENSKQRWLKNRLDKDKAKAGSKSFVSHQPRRSSKKVKLFGERLSRGEI